MKKLQAYEAARSIKILAFEAAIPASLAQPKNNQIGAKNNYFGVSASAKMFPRRLLIKTNYFETTTTKLQDLEAATTRRAGTT